MAAQVGMKWIKPYHVKISKTPSNQKHYHKHYQILRISQVECRQRVQNRMNFNSLPCVVVVVCWGGFGCTIVALCSSNDVVLKYDSNEI